MPEFITIAVFNYAHEVVVLKSILENHQIPHYFKDENIVAVNPFASFAYGGIKLQVHPNDKEVVQSILDDLNDNLKIV
ncbi:MAG TPA: DUF2007 domain-containing protein [Flavobacterium sp.]|jgi:hypothetical protein